MLGRGFVANDDVVGFTGLLKFHHFATGAVIAAAAVVIGAETGRMRERRI